MQSFLVDKFLAPLGNALAPEKCRWCGVRVAHGPVCLECSNALPWNRSACRACALPLISAGAAVCGECLKSAPSQDSSWAAFRYENPVVQQILRLKFHEHLQAAHLLGALMAGALAARAEKLPELLIPVPLHRRRLRQRGYNQAVEIGRVLSRLLSIPLATDTAHRPLATKEQTELSAVERRRNMRGAFSVSGAVQGRHIALLDDVITTGATVAELARTARKAGAVRIEAWAVARA